ncbi:ribose-phosphate diphosphokinase [Rhizobium sp. S95]|uniref:ribose-phosphate diphosphokinase n=1 Tax=Ciceribacter sichuanensis TaxID=2949647 RepID=A0AAJ1C158_9HYPH|nr:MULTISPECIES: ribose-phosphate diphosphokinase [unclassified Ciceribacter]MCM2396613.1 ribose-phosphate diphosphokinase [Ciceribacter sp. S95]MCO5959894.1 ribose-phosphate diphosphokinase [Ciceribacter sp. S101]
MTTMALTAPAFGRLFSRIDSAPQPHARDTQLLLESWSGAKADRLAPGLLDLETMMPGALLIFVKEEGRRDYRLRMGEQFARRLLGRLHEGERLSQAPYRRNAARCRRVFDKVIQTGEPLLVEFTAEQGNGDAILAYELLALPLSGSGDALEAVAVGVSWRSGLRAVPAINGRQWNSRAPKVFAFARDESLAKAIARSLRLELAPLEEREFEDGEHKARPLVDVSGQDAFIIASLHRDERQSVNDRLCRLLFFIGTLKTNGAARVVAVIPYLCYQRKDRQTKPYDPLTSRYVAQLLEAVGADQVITMEAHNIAALQNGFRCTLIHLESHDAFAHHLVARLHGSDVTVVAPDMGAAKRAEAFRTALESHLGRPVEKAFMEKQRSMGVVTGDLFAGNVAGRRVVVFDDMISSGTTMMRAAEACRQRGAIDALLAATHGLFSAGAADTLSDPFISAICVANTVACEKQISRLEIVDVSATFARAMLASSPRALPKP